jgi:thiol-disulfide isomerase/thioredoxin
MASLNGQVVVLHLWATWCAPCRKEMPRLDELNTELEKRGGRVLAVSIDIDPRNVERFLLQQHVKLPVAIDGPDGLARELDVPAIPYTVVLNRSGDVVSLVAGSGDAMLETTTATARRLLAEKPMATRTDSEETR